MAIELEKSTPSRHCTRIGLRTESTLYGPIDGNPTSTMSNYSGTATSYCRSTLPSVPAWNRLGGPRMNFPVRRTPEAAYALRRNAPGSIKIPSRLPWSRQPVRMFHACSHFCRKPEGSESVAGVVSIVNTFQLLRKLLRPFARTIDETHCWADPFSSRAASSARNDGAAPTVVANPTGTDLSPPSIVTRLMLTADEQIGFRRRAVDLHDLTVQRRAQHDVTLGILRVMWLTQAFRPESPKTSAPTKCFSSREAYAPMQTNRANKLHVADARAKPTAPEPPPITVWRMSGSHRRKRKRHVVERNGDASFPPATDAPAAVPSPTDGRALLDRRAAVRLAPPAAGWDR